MTDLQRRCLDLADEMAQEINGDLSRVPDDAISACFDTLSEENLRETAAELADLAAWFN